MFVRRESWYYIFKNRKNDGAVNGGDIYTESVL